MSGVKVLAFAMVSGCALCVTEGCGKSGGKSATMDATLGNDMATLASGGVSTGGASGSGGAGTGGAAKQGEDASLGGVGGTSTGGSGGFAVGGSAGGGGRQDASAEA